MTVFEAFQTFKSKLELPDRKQKLAAFAQQDLRSQLAKQMIIADSMLTGSYSRYTKIAPLTDIDIFLIRNQRRTALSTDGTGVYAHQALDELADAVRKAYPQTASIQRQARSVNVEIAGLDFGFDIIPAWLRQPDGYWIPDTDLGNWIPSDPDAHATILTQANDNTDGKLKPLIKMMKFWSRNNHDLIRSFHLELICADIFSREELKNFPLGVAIVLQSLPTYVGQQFMDPIYGVSRVDKPLSEGELTKLRLRINSDAQNSIQALKFEAAGQYAEAIQKWKYIFVNGFPE